MASHNFTDDDVKRILKNFFAEKKRVKELEKRLEAQENQNKIYLTEKHPLTEEYTKLKTAYLEQEKERELLKRQQEKIRPALKKLVDNLKQAHAEIAFLKENAATENKEEEACTHQRALNHANQEALEIELHQLRDALQRQRLQLLKTEEEKRALNEAIAQHKQEIAYLQREKTVLVERLAAALNQNQNLSSVLIGFKKERAAIKKDQS